MDKPLDLADAELATARETAAWHEERRGEAEEGLRLQAGRARRASGGQKAAERGETLLSDRDLAVNSHVAVNSLHKLSCRWDWAHGDPLGNTCHLVNMSQSGRRVL